MTTPKFKQKISKEELKKITSSRRKKHKHSFNVVWSTELNEDGETYDAIQLVETKKE